jgi:hypothetical protein
VCGRAGAGAARCVRACVRAPTDMSAQLSSAQAVRGRGRGHGMAGTVLGVWEPCALWLKMLWLSAAVATNPSEGVAGTACVCLRVSLVLHTLTCAPNWRPAGVSLPPSSTTCRAWCGG